MVRNKKPLPLHCAGGTCSVEVSSFCLQRHRKAPISGTSYQPSAQTVISLIYNHGKQEAMTRIPVTRHVRIFSNRGYSSVKLQIPASLVKSSGGSVPKISIGARSAAVPVALEGDPHPQSEQEIATYTGPMRIAADQVVAARNYQATVVDSINRLINGLPDDEPAQTGQEDRLWKKVIGPKPGHDAPAGLRFTAKELKYCATASRDAAAAGISGFGVRGCLKSTHDEFMIEQNHKVWKKLKAGS